VAGFALAAPILGVINADIGPSPYLTWVALAYTLPVAIGLLLVGRLSDLFGRRWFFILGSVLALIVSWRFQCL
jgi:MFS family permease